LLSVLTSAKHLRVLGLDEGRVCRQLFDRAVTIAAAMDPRLIQQYLDVASTAPISTEQFMSLMLDRLTLDAQKLQTNNLVAIVDLLASYPPAKSSVTAAALGATAAMRAESFDREALTTVLLGLTEMGNHSDDMVLLAERLSADKNGFKSPTQLFEFLQFLAPDALSTRRGQDCVSALVHHLTPQLSADDLTELRSELARLKLEERSVIAKAKARADNVRRDDRDREHRISEAAAFATEGYHMGITSRGGHRGGGFGHRGGGGGRGGPAPPRFQAKPPPPKGKQPFNLKKAQWDLD
jgi:hypothetical protein